MKNRKKLDRVLIAGSRGFVGKAITPTIKKKYQVIELVHSAKNIKDKNVITVDISNFQTLEKVFQKVLPTDFVIHLAANRNHDASWAEVFKNNIIGTRNIYECARIHKVKRVIFASSTHLVGGYPGYPQTSSLGRPITTTDPLRPDGYYGISKGFGELIARHYYDMYGLESICIRIGALGGKDKPGVPYEKLWLSYRDAANIFLQALKTSIPFGIYFATSDNKDKIYDITSTKKELGFNPLNGTNKQG